jgi:hypothetical protein
MKHRQHPVNARIRLGLVALALVLSLGAADTARAAPANDNFADAMWIEALPFSAVQDPGGATIERHEPRSECGSSIDVTVWFRFTPSTDVTLNANTVGSNYDLILAVYTGQAFKSLSTVGCGAGGNSALREVVFVAAAGVTYHFQVAGYRSAVGTLQFNLGPQAPPFNDNFADAPQFFDGFRDVRDTTFATMEPLELAPCGMGSASVWYGITPSTTVPITAYTDSPGNYDTVLAVYLDTGVGTGFERLALQACNDDRPSSSRYSEIRFVAAASNTYYFQVGAFMNDGGGNLVVSVEVGCVVAGCV